MSLSLQQQMLIEQRVPNQAKSAGVAYLLLIGGLGIHRLYLGRTGSGVTMLILFILGWLTLVIGIGLVLLLVVGLWAFADLFLVPGMIERQKASVRSELKRQMLVVGTQEDANSARALPEPGGRSGEIALPHGSRS